MRHLYSLLLPLSVLTVACGSDIEPSPGTPVPELITIQEARSSAFGTFVHVAGFVSVEHGTFLSSTGDLGFAIQDETGGIYVTLDSSADAPQDAKVEVVGELVDAVGQDAILTNLTGVRRLMETQEVMPVVLKTGDVNEFSEGKLVRIAGTVTKAVVDEKPFGMRTFIDDGSGEVQVYINLIGDKPIVDTTKLKIGAVVQITGLSSQNETTYEVLPRRGSDLVAP